MKIDTIQENRKRKKQKRSIRNAMACSQNPTYNGMMLRISSLPALLSAMLLCVLIATPVFASYPETVKEELQENCKELGRSQPEMLEYCNCVAQATMRYVPYELYSGQREATEVDDEIMEQPMKHCVDKIPGMGNESGATPHVPGQ